MGGKGALRLLILFLWGTPKKRPNHRSHTRLEDVGPTKDYGYESPTPNFQGPIVILMELCWAWDVSGFTQMLGTSLKLGLMTTAPESQTLLFLLSLRSQLG